VTAARARTSTRRRYAYFATEDTQAALDKQLDQYGDAFEFDATVATLKMV
jgi:hypothetical protein